MYGKSANENWNAYRNVDADIIVSVIVTVSTALNLNVIAAVGVVANLSVRLGDAKNTWTKNRECIYTNSNENVEDPVNVYVSVSEAVALRVIVRVSLSVYRARIFSAGMSVRSFDWYSLWNGAYDKRNGVL